MGIFTRYATAVLISTFLLGSAQAATRTGFNPSGASVISQASSSGTITLPDGGLGLVGPDRYYELQPGQGFTGGQSVGPTIRPAPVSTVGQVQFPYGPAAALPNEKIPGTVKIAVKPQVNVTKPKLITALKNGLKANPGAIAMQVATGAALAAVGWVMSPDNTELQKPTYDVDNSLSLYWCGESQSQYCSGSSASNKRYATPEIAKGALDSFYCSQYGSMCAPGSVVSTLVLNGSSATYNWSFPVVGANYSLSGGTPLYRHGSCSADFVYISTTGVCQSSAPSSFASLTESDYSKIDPWANAQSAAWFTDMIKEVCLGSLKPQSCFNAMKEGSKLSGPASIAGPSVTKTGTYTKPDGSTGTTSSVTTTNYTFNYGDNYFDTKTTTTTTNTTDGAVTSTETVEDTTPADESTDDPAQEEESEESYTFNDSDLPAVEPFYTQKYPDGFQGVWDSANTDFEQSAFVSFLNSFVPSFSGSCPAFSMSFAIGGVANFGTHGFGNLCYALDFVKVCIMLGALFLCRAIVFGG